MTDRPAPRCPRDGNTMTLMLHYYPRQGRMALERRNYRCSCGLTMPSADTDEAAYSAAMQRYVEPNRVLDWDEFKARIQTLPVWMESKEIPCHSDWIVPDDDDPVTDADRAGYESGVSRAWLRRPTDEEREAVPWE